MASYDRLEKQKIEFSRLGLLRPFASSCLTRTVLVSRFRILHSGLIEIAAHFLSLAPEVQNFRLLPCGFCLLP